VSGKHSSSSGGLRVEALVWATRGLVLFAVWSLSTIYQQITSQIASLDQRVNSLASGVARIETILERDR